MCCRSSTAWRARPWRSDTRARTSTSRPADDRSADEAAEAVIDGLARKSADMPVGAERWGKADPSPEVRRFLQGPQPRGFELVRAIRIFAELMRGFRALHFVGPCVTVFGSARFPERHPYY